MYPELFSIGPITIYTYGVLLAVSYLLGLWLAMRRARKWGLDANRILDLGIYIIIAALVGAKLLLLVVDFDQFSRSPAELLTLARSGGVFYGGLILAVIVGFWYVSRHRLPFWTTCDVFAPGIALGHVTGRLGCLAAGCCYGRPADVPWAITFTSPLAAANVGTPLGIPLHPTQIYEAGAELLILGLLILLATFDPNDYRPQIVKLVKDRTGRDLSIGDIGLKVFPKIGAQLKQVSLAQRSGGGEFAGVGDAQVYVALLPLLSRQVVVDEVRVDGLRANLVKHADGLASRFRDYAATARSNRG